MAVLSDYVSGTISLTNGEVDFTGDGTAWQLAQIREGDTIFYLPGTAFQGVISEITSNVAGKLDRAWEGPDLIDVPYRIRQLSDGSRATSQSAMLREQLGNGNVQALAGLTGANDHLAVFTGPGSMRLAPKSEFINGVAVDKRLNTMAERAAYDAQPDQYSVYIANVGDAFGAENADRAATFFRAGDTPGVWSDPAFVTGAEGSRGWSDVRATVVDGERRVEQLVDWVGGEGVKPGGIGKYFGPTGLVDTMAEATDVRGPAGDISGVTPFWQDRITQDATPEASVRALGLLPSTALPTLNGRVGNIRQISRAIRDGAAKVVIVGDSIAVGRSQTSYGDSFPGLLAEHLRQNIKATWTFENYSIDGTGVGEYVNSGYNGYSPSSGPAMSPPQYELWPSGSTPTKPWRDWAKDAAPDLLVIAFGMNASGDEGASAASMNLIIDYIETWSKVPSIILVTPMLSSRINGGGAPFEHVQASADAWRGIAAQRNVSLADANAIYRLLLDGEDIQRTPKRRRDLSDFASWVDISGTRPSVAGGTMTFGAPGWVEHPDLTINCEVTATFNLDGSDIADLHYRRAGSNNSYIVRVLHAGGTSTVAWFGPGPTLLHSEGIASAAAYKVHVEAIGARHRIWVNGNAIALPGNGINYAQLFPGRLGLAFSQGAGTVTAFDARLGFAKVYGSPRYTEADLLGINDWASNPDSIGGNGINHPSVIASLLVYFAAFKPVLESLENAAQTQLPMAVRAQTDEIVTSFAANDYIEASIAGVGPAQVSFVGGVSPNQFGSSNNVQVLNNAASAVINGRRNGTTFVTHTLTFPHIGKWLVCSSLTISTSAGGVRHVLTSWATEVH